VAQIIFALDYDNINEAREKVKELKSEIEIFKIGLQLFTQHGPKAVEMVKNEGSNVFLDLKLHDIPKTCAMAARAAAQLGCFAITMHIQAGAEALSEARKCQIDGLPHIWGVTVLSSIKEGDSLQRAQIANESKINGVVVSGHDVIRVREKFPELELVVPGIRPSDYIKKDDQKRVLTPGEAVKRGADYLVIGRPIKEAANPLLTVQRIKEEIELSNIN
jgi:orotidine-5'-phosphate decarboxylase